MKVDFDKLRLNTLKNYERLVKILNDHVNNEGDLNITKYGSINELEDVLNDLRMQIITICCSYNENGETFKDVLPDREIISFETHE